MTPEEIEKMQADLAATNKELASVTTANETLRGYLLAEGYSISADGVSKETKEFLTVGDEQVDVATLPKAVVTALKAAEAKAEDDKVTEIASKTLPNFALDDAKAIVALVGNNETVMTSLKAADAAMGKLMEEAGETNPEADMISAKDKFEALIETHMTENSLTGNVGRARALSAVISTAEGKELEAKARKETK